MPETNIGNTDTSSLASAQSDWSVDTEVLDGPQDQKETEYQIQDWATKFGHSRTSSSNRRQSYVDSWKGNQSR